MSQLLHFALTNLIIQITSGLNCPRSAPYLVNQSVVTEACVTAVAHLSWEPSLAEQMNTVKCTLLNTWLCITFAIISHDTEPELVRPLLRVRAELKTHKVKSVALPGDVPWLPGETPSLHAIPEVPGTLWRTRITMAAAPVCNFHSSNSR